MTGEDDNLLTGSDRLEPNDLQAALGIRRMYFRVLALVVLFYIVAIVVGSGAAYLAVGILTVSWVLGFAGINHRIRLERARRR
jgi:hypothetical protein